MRRKVLKTDSKNIIPLRVKLSSGQINLNVQYRGSDLPAADRECVGVVDTISSPNYLENHDYEGFLILEARETTASQSHLQPGKQSKEPRIP
jgi:hypothetical protein